MTQANLSYPDDAKQWLDSLPNETIASLGNLNNVSNINNLATPTTISTFVDGRHLSCPMPLLKTKIALRELKDNDILYVIATDPNSQADITAFCRQSQLTLNQASSEHDGMTIYHFLIAKTI